MSTKEEHARVAGRQWGLNMGAVAARQILEVPKGKKRMATRTATELLMKQGIVRSAARLECKDPEHMEAWIEAAETAMRESITRFIKYPKRLSPEKTKGRPLARR